MPLFLFTAPAFPQWIAEINYLNHKRDMCEGACILYKYKGRMPNNHLVDDVLVLIIEYDNGSRIYMSLRYYFAKAKKTLDRIAPYDRAIIDNQCRSIRLAEEKLQSAGRSAFLRCYSGCEGLCCRNLDLDAVIGFSDFIYLLTVEGQLKEVISTCLENEKPFFTGNCVFLINGNGPCMFPPTSRPEVCITSFCADIEPLKQEIWRVKLQFMKLNFYLLFLQFKILFRHVNNKSELKPLKGWGSRE